MYYVLMLGFTWHKCLGRLSGTSSIKMFYFISQYVELMFLSV